jgi:hypothetical protein
VPLILSLKEGDDFTVAGKRMHIVKVLPDRHFVVYHESTDTHFEIVMDRMSEVEPDVFVSSGDRANASTARVVIDAPREIRIKRSK